MVACCLGGMKVEVKRLAGDSAIAELAQLNGSSCFGGMGVVIVVVMDMGSRARGCFGLAE